MQIFRIAIDGPAGAGKSTVSQQLAKRLGFIYIDTGAMYRSVAWKALQELGSPENFTPETLKDIAENSKLMAQLDSKGMNHFFIDSIEITNEIRSQEVSAVVSIVAKEPKVREALLSQQQKIGLSHSVVMDGRDIGTHVFPQAELKVFLTASVEMRAERRCKEIVDKGGRANLETLKNEINLRDKMDEEREVAPLLAAEDALRLDTTFLDIDQVVDKIAELYEERSHALSIT